MGTERGAIIATTTLSKDTSLYEQVRGSLALKTIYEARSREHNVVVVDGGSPDNFIYKMLDLGAKVHLQETPGMGSARRQSLRIAKESAPTHDTAVVWIEPEKHTLIPFINEAADKVTNERYELVLFQRRSLDSYPPEEAYHYKLGQLAFKYLTDIDCDFFFGPVTMSLKSVDYFLAYKSKHGDLWDSIHVPKLHIMNDGLRWTQIPIDYQHPKEQTEAEQGNMDLFMKRLEQVRQITNALRCEVNDLGISIPNDLQHDFTDSRVSSQASLAASF